MSKEDQISIVIDFEIVRAAKSRGNMGISRKKERELGPPCRRPDE